jgi:dUTP pyrophosphatase
MTNPTPLPVQLLHPDAKLPYRATPGDAGHDLSSINWLTLDPGARCPVDTGIAVAIPAGHVGYIKPRSGLALRHGIDVLGGVIDSGYRGELKVILHNTDPEHSFDINPGDRIAQLVIQPVTHVWIVPVDALPAAERGTNGFGSTGITAAAL